VVRLSGRAACSEERPATTTPPSNALPPAVRECRGASSRRQSANGNPRAASACARTSPATAARRPAPPTAGPRDRASSSYAPQPNPFLPVTKPKRSPVPSRDLPSGDGTETRAKPRVARE
jgi:hypothetical protein